MKSREVIEAAAERSRVTWHDRVARLRRLAPTLLLGAIAAGASWLIAKELFGQTGAFFAPVAAIITLGLTVGSRLERAIELTLGVPLGIALADVLVLERRVGRPAADRHRLPGDVDRGLPRRRAAAGHPGGGLGDPGGDAAAADRRPVVHAGGRRADRVRRRAAAELRHRADRPCGARPPRGRAAAARARRGARRDRPRAERARPRRRPGGAAPRPRHRRVDPALPGGADDRARDGGGRAGAPRPARAAGRLLRGRRSDRPRGAQRPGARARRGPGDRDRRPRPARRRRLAPGAAPGRRVARAVAGGSAARRRGDRAGRAGGAPRRARCWSRPPT